MVTPLKTPPPTNNFCLYNIRILQSGLCYAHGPHSALCLFPRGGGHSTLWYMGTSVQENYKTLKNIRKNFQ